MTDMPLMLERLRNTTAADWELDLSEVADKIERLCDMDIVHEQAKEIERLQHHIEEHQSRDALQQMEIERLRKAKKRLIREHRKSIEREKRLRAALEQISLACDSLQEAQQIAREVLK